ncbi:MAG: hypothetical protein D6763_04555 [Alphaproteobacteria bacterium]|nr:MAG: hypothetical protein D6763_04555 [Alphaproteobacteria bacterium]
MRKIFGAVVAALGVAAACAANATVVLSNNAAPGDSVTNPGGPDVTVPIGASDWYYSSVRQTAEIGITNTNPRSGNGSVEFSSTSGTGKADITYLPAENLGAFSALDGMSFDWYRSGVSTNPAIQMPALRVLLDADGDLGTTGDRGGLVYEAAYNGGVVPTDEWVTANVTGSTNLWNFGLGLPFADGGYGVTLSDWQSMLSDAIIIGFNAGVGSGWNGSFVGFVDNIGWTIAGETSVTNFEVQASVPAPGAVWLFLGVLGGIGAVRRLGNRKLSA